MTNTALPQPAARSKTTYLLETISHIGFLAFATACGALFFLQGQEWIILSPPFKVLFLAAWCPFFWGQYWSAKRAGSRRTWFVFLCAILSSATAVLAAIVTLIRLAG
jgi:hypothetical protein